MAAHIGIVNKFGLETPDDGYAHETRRKGTVEFVTTKNEQGVTVEVEPLPYTKYDITMRGVGRPDFALVAAASAANDEPLILSVKESEANKEDSKFEITAETYTNAVVIP